MLRAQPPINACAAPAAVSVRLAINSRSSSVATTSRLKPSPANVKLRLLNPTLPEPLLTGIRDGDRRSHAQPDPQALVVGQLCGVQISLMRIAGEGTLHGFPVRSIAGLHGVTEAWLWSPRHA